MYLNIIVVHLFSIYKLKYHQTTLEIKLLQLQKKVSLSHPHSTWGKQSNYWDPPP